ncbi:MAG: hypothetical protein JKY48_07025, partial [Flavobacteriales bacterium]|nr:hypothetical protein [Flavobacteriales bacterium]
MLLTCATSLFADIGQNHSDGVSFAREFNHAAGQGVGGINPNTVPGFVTAEPKEVTLTAEGMKDGGHSVENDGVAAIRESAKGRKKWKINDWF